MYMTLLVHRNNPGLGMTPVLSPAQMKKKDAWVGDEKPAQRQSCVG